ncbi:hypothetical protein [Crocosphaera sp. XPORK-15E]|nr:hypothetical protein [Crocosphaera sp. XPORK-15E]MEA5537144.1 hypothetical protein [Crocosphaera sp. XPORK-15E]
MTLNDRHFENVYNALRNLAQTMEQLIQRQLTTEENSNILSQ